MKKLIAIYITNLIFIIATLFLFSHLLILNGVLKERESKECISLIALSNLQSIVAVNQELLQVPKEIIKELKTNFNEQIKSCNEEKDKWKSWYNYEKKNCIVEEQ